MVQLIFKIVFFSSISIAFQSYARAYTSNGTGKLISCVSPQNQRRGKVCTIRLQEPIKHIPRGSVVSAYNKRGYWQSSGTLYARRGMNLVVIFKNNLSAPDRDGFFRLATSFDNFEWESAFDKNRWF